MLNKIQTRIWYTIPALHCLLWWDLIMLLTLRHDVIWCPVLKFEYNTTNTKWQNAGGMLSLSVLITFNMKLHLFNERKTQLPRDCLWSFVRKRPLMIWRGRVEGKNRKLFSSITCFSWFLSSHVALKQLYWGCPRTSNTFKNFNLNIPQEKWPWKMDRQKLRFFWGGGWKDGI